MSPTENISSKMQQPERHEKPAIIIAAFGSSRRGKAALDLFDQKVSEKYGDHEIRWAYTSSIIRKKTGNPSLHQTLANVVAAGFNKAVVLPLQVFPGSEYQDIFETAMKFPGLRAVVGETLMHRWNFVKEVLSVVEKDFLQADQGLNLLALHGTPIAGDMVNNVYLGLERLVVDRYTNVLAASLEGVPDYQAVLQKVARLKLSTAYGCVRIIPMMYIAGLHVEDDLMGEENSWKSRLQDMGFKVECLTTDNADQTFFKSLASYPQIQEFFLRRLARCMALI